MPRPTPNSRFNFVQVGDESLLYDNDTHDVIHVDGPGSIIWALCDGTRTIEQIIELIANAYPDSRDAVAIDVQETITRLVEQSALKLEP